jgi:formate-dependent phosphoribosylglycinamide formyltransferase (GAR transformylase)
VTKVVGVFVRFSCAASWCRTFGVEFFLADDGVLLRTLPRPHDTGMVTLAGTQNFNEFELHLRAILSLPIFEITLEKQVLAL